MKKAVLVAFLLLTLLHGRTEAQLVYIPDPNFVNWLNNNGYSSCLNGFQQLDTTCLPVINALEVNCSSDSIINLQGIQYFDNLIRLKCFDSWISFIPAFPPNLKYLACGTNNLTTIPNLPASLDTLDVRSNNLSSLPPLPPNLRYLDVARNNFTSLPALPDSIQMLSCFENQLASLPTLPLNLFTFYCNYNLLTSLPVLPNNLRYLYCYNNNLTSLPTMPQSINTIDCNNNQLTSLPTLDTLNNLDQLECNNNLLTNLPSLPNGLLDLECINNPITSLPTLPNSLEALRAGNCQLTNLPALNSLLDLLSVPNNQITQLPTLPANLRYLYCTGNPITSLPVIPATLRTIECQGTLISSIPELPDSMYTLMVGFNPNLYCLPELKRIVNLRFQSSVIQCIPNYGNVTTSIPALNTLPLCDIFNTNNCDFYYNISGLVYNDDNGNCVADVGESSISGLKINLTQGGTLVQQGYTSQSGLYTIAAQSGTYDYTVDTVGVPYLVSCPPSGIHNSVLTLADSIDLGKDFGLECKPGFDIGVSSVNCTAGQFFPADSAFLKVRAGDLSNQFNLNCASGVSGTVTVYFTGPVQFGGILPGSLIPTVSPNTLTYTIPDFGSVNMSTDFGFYLITDTTAQAGQQVCLTVSVTPSTSDLNPLNNMFTHCFTVVNSFDPNIKEASPVGITTPDSWINYTIRFQNTGSAPAQHIVITDTLDADIQESTFIYQASSHNVFVNVTGNVVKFTFPNINLPDSTTDEPGSHGYVQFKVKSDPNLALGVAVENTANIYFDFNPPVITNTTLNTVVLPTGMNESTEYSFEIFPNPVSETVTVQVHSALASTFKIYDLTGRIVYERPIFAELLKIDLSQLPDGIYLAEISGNNLRTLVKKLMISH